MVTNNILKIFSIILICVFGLCIIYISIPFTALFIHSVIDGLKCNPSHEPKPQVSYGEFPLELTYTIDEDTIKISDIYICEYSGYIESIDFLEWDGYMKSTKEIGFLIYDKGNTKIFCLLGYPSYYMGELQEEPHPVIVEEKGAGSGTITEEELLKNYGIELKTWKTASPIKNSFEEFKEKTKTQGDGSLVFCTVFLYDNDNYMYGYPYARGHFEY